MTRKINKQEIIHILELRKEGKTLREIATIMGCSYQAVSLRLKSAERICARIISDKEKYDKMLQLLK